MNCIIVHDLHIQSKYSTSCSSLPSKYGAGSAMQGSTPSSSRSRCSRSCACTSPCTLWAVRGRRKVWLLLLVVANFEFRNIHPIKGMGLVGILVIPALCVGLQALKEGSGGEGTVSSAPCMYFDWMNILKIEAVTTNIISSSRTVAWVQVLLPGHDGLPFESVVCCTYTRSHVPRGGALHNEYNEKYPLCQTKIPLPLPQQPSSYPP
jgi:hypothetical protein